jgi:hypothetical protein
MVATSSNTSACVTATNEQAPQTCVPGTTIRNLSRTLVLSEARQQAAQQACFGSSNSMPGGMVGMWKGVTGVTHATTSQLNPAMEGYSQYDKGNHQDKSTWYGCAAALTSSAGAAGG